MSNFESVYHLPLYYFGLTPVHEIFQADTCLYQLLTCLNAHHELKTVVVCSACKQEDTGKHKLDDIIKEVATGTHYESSELIPIYDAYNAATLNQGGSAWRLRDAIRSRLTQDDLIALVADVTLDENAPLWIDSD